MLFLATRHVINDREGVGVISSQRETDRTPRRELLIARPRGFCAGVERAIGVVDHLLEAHGTPLYVRKEIVHNQAVVDGFRKRGVNFIEELDEAPDGALVVFSAHGVSPSVRAEAEARGLRVVDATCPLVTRVHRSVVKHAEAGRPIVLIGHAGHDEVAGTMGEAPDQTYLVETVEDVAELPLSEDTDLAYVTQTTLGVDETAAIIEALAARYPNLRRPGKDDICYATTNRQTAVKALVEEGATHVLVVGSRNSSNSVRLCEVARDRGADATLVDGPDEVDIDAFADHDVIGLTAGASAPEDLVEAVTARLEAAGWRPRETDGVEENVKFKMPRELTAFE
ncbi:4-hydroxy-3-methylbut-2-enyl diphosphate reductase [bacterium]|jgi:4-hydroxy-3-methylbut-2-enyl diphosphate reductase|nr:4-hydroxy-3-methylbut-2-enyl diphosphate reductase [bacterium]